MKKTISTMAVAMLTLCSALFVSCDNHDEKTTVYQGSITSVIATDDSDPTAETLSAVVAFVSSKLSGKATVAATGTTTFTVTTSSPNDSEAQEIMKALSDSELNAALQKVTSLMRVGVTIKGAEGELSSGELYSYIYLNEYTVTLGVNDEFLDLFDVKVTRTDENTGETNEMNLNEGEAGTVTDDDMSESGKYVSDACKPVYASKVKFVVTCTLKDDWKTRRTTFSGLSFIIQGKENGEAYSESNTLDNPNIDVTYTDEEKKKSLEDFAKVFLESFKFSY